MKIVEKVRALIAAGQQAEAADLCERNLETPPASAETAILAGLLFAIRGQHNDAIGAYDMALSFAPDALHAYIGIAESLAEKGWLHSAVVVMENARDTASLTDEAQKLLETLRLRLPNQRHAAVGVIK